MDVGGSRLFVVLLFSADHEGVTAMLIDVFDSIDTNGVGLVSWEASRF